MQSLSLSLSNPHPVFLLFTCSTAAVLRSIQLVYPPQGLSPLPIPPSFPPSRALLRYFAIPSPFQLARSSSPLPGRHAPTLALSGSGAAVARARYQVRSGKKIHVGNTTITVTTTPAAKLQHSYYSGNTRTPTTTITPPLKDSYYDGKINTTIPLLLR